MMTRATKAIYAGTALLLCFAAAGATGGGSGGVSNSSRSAATNHIQVVVRGERGGPWKAYLFGAECSGEVSVRRGDVADDPVVVECRRDQGVVDPDEVEGKDGEPVTVAERRRTR